MKIDVTNFVKNIPYMFKGMIGLFISLGLIALSIIFLNSLSSKKNK